MIDATGGPAGFALVGSQRRWFNAMLGKLMQTGLRGRHGGPLVIVDEVEKAGVHLSRGCRHRLTDALLPLLERMTAATWEDPFFQVKCAMSHMNWVVTANGRVGPPESLCGLEPPGSDDSSAAAICKDRRRWSVFARPGNARTDGCLWLRCNCERWSEFADCQPQSRPRSVSGLSTNAELRWRYDV